MKQHFREIVAFLGIFLATLLFTATFAMGDEVSPGQKTFESKCAQCHGKDAKGNVKMAKVIKVDPVNVDLTREDAAKLTADDMAKIVSGGKNKMPKFKGKLTPEQIKQVVDYIKSLQGAKPAAQ